MRMPDAHIQNRAYVFIVVILPYCRNEQAMEIQLVVVVLAIVVDTLDNLPDLNVHLCLSMHQLQFPSQLPVVDFHPDLFLLYPQAPMKL